MSDIRRNPLLASIEKHIQMTSDLGGDGVSQETPTVTPQKAPARASTKLVGGHFNPEVSRQLRLIAAEEDTTIQALLGEAIDLLFVKKGKAKIAQLTQRSR